MSKKMQETLLVSGPVGNLEVEIHTKPEINYKYLAVLGHPHPLHGGTMHNKIITTLMRTFLELNIPCIRFNFRGVGESFGIHDAGIGETEDLIAIVNWWRKEHLDAKIILAGFSFGSYVTYRATKDLDADLLISISPPVHHYDFTEFLPLTCPWFIIQGDNDDVVPLQVVIDFITKYAVQAKLEIFAGATHFFHGRLLELREKVFHYVRKHLL